jgi:hypothetical protein
MKYTNIYRKGKLQAILFIYNLYIKYTNIYNIPQGKTYKNIYRKGKLQPILFIYNIPQGNLYIIYRKGIYI